MSAKLKYFVRLDSKNLPVLDSMIARKRKPQSGTWLEVKQGVGCCPEEVVVPPAPATAVADITGDYGAAGTKTITYQLGCGPIQGEFSVTSTTVYTLSSIRQELEGVWGQFAIFGLDGSILTVTSSNCDTLQLLITVI
jgi:hypothetical protein